MTRWREDVVERTESVRFSGGPLDGRVSALPAMRAVYGNVITHVHLHEGPKIETHYRLGVDPDGGWEYRLLDP
jgi:hypothetical protein